MDYLDLLRKGSSYPFRVMGRGRNYLKGVREDFAEASINNYNPFTGKPLVRPITRAELLEKGFDSLQGRKPVTSVQNWMVDFHGRSAAGHLLHTPSAVKTAYKQAFGTKLGLGLVGAFAIGQGGNVVGNVARTAYDTGAFTVGGQVGAAIGGSILPVIGAPIGYLVGGLTATMLPDIGMGISGSVARYGVQQRGRIRNSPTYIDTQQAATMRQRSMNIMRDNLMLHRRVMGQEAKYYHS